MTATVPIHTADLFPELDAHLLALLRGLSPDDWHRPTVCSQWTVKDIASHLLDGTLRRLSAQRDGYRAPADPAAAADLGSYEKLVGYLNRLNADWTGATRGVSAAVVVRLLDVTGPELAE